MLYIALREAGLRFVLALCPLDTLHTVANILATCFGENGKSSRVYAAPNALSSQRQSTQVFILQGISLDVEL